jgi:hypothetical protein
MNLLPFFGFDEDACSQSVLHFQRVHSTENTYCCSHSVLGLA